MLTSQLDELRLEAARARDAQRKSLERLQEVRQREREVVTEAKRQGSEDVACQRALCEAAAAETKRKLTSHFEATDLKRQAATERTLDRMEESFDDGVASVRAASLAELAAAKLQAEAAEDAAKQAKIYLNASRAKARDAVEEMEKAQRKVARTERKAAKAQQEREEEEERRRRRRRRRRLQSRFRSTCCRAETRWAASRLSRSKCARFGMHRLGAAWLHRRCRTTSRTCWRSSLRASRFPA